MIATVKFSTTMSKDDLPTRQPSPSPVSRRAAAIDLILSTSVVLVSIPWASPANSMFRRMSGVAAVLALALYQCTAEGLAPLLLIAIRGEKVSHFGVTLRGLGKSLVLALAFAAAYDLMLSLLSGTWVWVPLRHHSAVRLSLGTGLLLRILGLSITIVAWGVVEAFFGVFFAKRVTQMIGSDGKRWLNPGAIGFGLFNGLIHLAIGQGMAGFLTSFASGYVIGVIPAVTKNAWGSALFQALTNSVGRL